MIGMFQDFTAVAFDLEKVGLFWKPRVGDEVTYRSSPEEVTVLLDSTSLSERQLRDTYLWLPKTEQLMAQIEARQAVLFHAGLELTDNRFCYRAVVQLKSMSIEAEAATLRSALGISLRDILVYSKGMIQ